MISLFFASQVGAVEAFNNDQSGGPIGTGAQAAAEFIVDDSTPISVNANSASFNYEDGGAQASNSKSVGRFQNGITTPGTLLPDENQADLDLVLLYWDGYYEWAADFDRDGDVDQDDRDILDAYHGLTQCASKFHGDADGDGDVDDDDIDIWELEEDSSY